MEPSHPLDPLKLVFTGTLDTDAPLRTFSRTDEESVNIKYSTYRIIVGERSDETASPKKGTAHCIGQAFPRRGGWRDLQWRLLLPQRHCALALRAGTADVEFSFRPVKGYLLFFSVATDKADNVHGCSALNSSINLHYDEPMHEPMHEL